MTTDCSRECGCRLYIGGGLKIQKNVEIIIVRPLSWSLIDIVDDIIWLAVSVSLWYTQFHFRIIHNKIHKLWSETNFSFSLKHTKKKLHGKSTIIFFPFRPITWNENVKSTTNYFCGSVIHFSDSLLELFEKLKLFKHPRHFNYVLLVYKVKRICRGSLSCWYHYYASKSFGIALTIHRSYYVCAIHHRVPNAKFIQSSLF